MKSITCQKVLWKGLKHEKLWREKCQKFEGFQIPIMERKGHMHIPLSLLGLGILLASLVGSHSFSHPPTTTSTSTSTSPTFLISSKTLDIPNRKRYGIRSRVLSPSLSPSVLLATGGPLSVRIKGCGSAAPSTSISNAQLETVVETSDEWIQTRTGIASRRLLSSQTDGEGVGECMSSLAVEAGNKALEMWGGDREEIGMVVVCTSSPDDLFGDATTVAAEVSD